MSDTARFRPGGRRTIVAILGSVLVVTACQSHDSSSSAGATPSTAASPVVPPPLAVSSLPAASPSPAGGSTPPASASASASVPAAASGSASVPGVVDCGVSYQTLYIQPDDITIMCGDGDGGVEDMTWSSWGASTATGHGEYYYLVCVPSCAEGKQVTDPVQVTLSGVKTSSYGTYFSELTMQWQGADPPPSSWQRSYPLTAPTAR